jgi:hypothetical protein
MNTDKTFFDSGELPSVSLAQLICGLAAPGGLDLEPAIRAEAI